MLIRETFVNKTKNHTFSKTDWYEPFTSDRGKLFRELQREYGRCGSKMYVDTPAGPKQTGWVFENKMEYTDYRGRGDRYYVREVWVHVKEEN